MRFISMVLLVLFLASGGGWAQTPAESPQADATPATETAPTPIPLGEIAAQLQAVRVQLRDLAQAQADPQIDPIRQALPLLRQHVSRLLQESNLMMQGNPSIEEVRSTQSRWADLRTPLPGWQALLSRRAGTADEQLQEVEQLASLWEATLKSAREAQAPDELLAGLTDLPQQLDSARQSILEQRTELLGLQAQLTEQQTRIRGAVASLTQVRAQAVDRIFSQDSPPLWSGAAYATGYGLSVLAQACHTEWEAWLAYLATHLGNLFVHLALGALLTLALAMVGARVEPWAEREPELSRPLTIFDAPLSMTLVLSLVLNDTFYPDAPAFMSAFLVLLALVPASRLLTRLLGTGVRPLLAFLVANYLFDQVRDLVHTVPLAARLLLLLQMAIGALFMLGYLCMHRGTRRLDGRLRLVAWTGLAAFSLACVANLAGWVSLARLVGTTTLGASYLGLVLFAFLNILDGLLLLATLVPPLSLLGLISNHRVLLRRRLRNGLEIVFGIAWLAYVLEHLNLLDPLCSGLGAALHAGVTVGNFHLQIRNLLAFAVIIWVATLASRVLRFALEEDVYPRVDLPRGLPYALSASLHYAVLVLGFVTAMGALGVDVGRFAVLAGALSVGIGFGLQNIVNNFVSGLILLFERPVKVGDTVRIGGQIGELQKIGLRASVLRTWEGTDVIVPNGSLIAQEVTNFTLSHPCRRLDMQIGVAYGTPIAPLLKLLARTAGEHPEVLPEPAPEALFLEFGESALLFQLRASTQAGAWMRVRSEVLTQLNEELAKAGIEIPFPHRTLLIRSEAPEWAHAFPGK